MFSGYELSYRLKWIGEGEGGGEGGGEGTTKTYTQAEFDKHMAGLRRKYETQHESLSSEIEKLKSRSNLTDQERSELESRLEQLKEESLTKEQQLSKELKKTQKEWETKYTSLETNHNTLLSRYQNETITRAITDAAIENDAFSPEQLVAILREHTQLVEELNESKEPTGVLKAMTLFTGQDEDGKEIKEKLPVKEAIKRMKSKPEKYGNLFKSEMVDGLNMFTGGKSNEVDMTKMSMEKYMELRKKGKKLL